jgi:DNA-binding beta-propeller fold protein YncE
MSSTKSTKRKTTATSSTTTGNKKAEKRSPIDEGDDDDDDADDDEKQEHQPHSDVATHPGDSVSFVLAFTVTPQSGAVNARFPSPLAVSTSPDGQTVYVCDVSNTSIQAYSKEGQYLSQWGGAGKTTGKFAKNGNLDMCLSQDTGELYVCDCKGSGLGDHDSIQVFDHKSGHFLHQYTEMTGPAVPRDDEFNGKVVAIRCTTSHDGRFSYILRNGERRILCADLTKSTPPQLHIVKVHGNRKKTSTGYQLIAARGFCASNDGAHLYVCDRNNRCVNRIDTRTDELLPVVGNKSKIAKVSPGPSELFSSPADVCLSASGRYLYVSDEARRLVQVFDTSDSSHCGDLVGLAGKNGKVDRTALRAPGGLCFCAATNRLYVCDSGNNTVVVYNALD